MVYKQGEYIEASEVMCFSINGKTVPPGTIFKVVAVKKETPFTSPSGIMTNKSCYTLQSLNSGKHITISAEYVEAFTRILKTATYLKFIRESVKETTCQPQKLNQR